ncbi:MAG TPA: hypothetical protein IAA29_01650, partial [Candidatus Paenibacillus intestinavium]|nr:hypothetical protein [Candidatus Paenibacillus intestinavium]
QLPFSIHYKKRKDQKIALIHAVICKGIDKELLTPINPSKNFNSLDQTINILYKLEFNLTSILIRIEVINPHKEVVIYDYTELILNDVKYEQTAFMCVPVLPQMEVGEWIINLICQDQIIFSQSFYYRELRSYTNKYQSYYAINTDYKV